MTTLELQLDDELGAFIERQWRSLGHPSAAAYVQSLLAVERLRNRSGEIVDWLRKADGESVDRIDVDDAYWKRVEAEVFGVSPSL